MSTVRSSQITATAKKIIANVERVIIGKRQEVVLAMVAYFCEGHVLLEDVPGVAKTMLARAIAKSVGGTFKRVQCTPDLLPTDITGASIFNQKTAEFEFRPGPIFAQIVLSDEINRATPRTQAALLEAMAERQVTVDGTTHRLAAPFFVIATQNPIDHEGTFPLPEAQLDRFLVRLALDIPARRKSPRCSTGCSAHTRSTIWPPWSQSTKCSPASRQCAKCTSTRSCAITSST